MKIAFTVIAAFLAVQIYASPVPEGSDPAGFSQGVNLVSDAESKADQKVEGASDTTADATGVTATTVTGGGVDGSHGSQVLKEVAAKLIGQIQKGLATGEWSKSFDYKLVVETLKDIFEHIVQLVVKDGMTKMLKASLSGPKSNLAFVNPKTTVTKAYETKSSGVTAPGNASVGTTPIGNTPTEITGNIPKDPRVPGKGHKFMRGPVPGNNGANYGLNGIPNINPQERSHGVHG